MNSILLILFLFSCSSHKENNPEKIRICTELYSDHSLKKGWSVLGGAHKDFIWEHKSGSPLVLNVKFLDGSSFQKGKVIQYAKYWTQASANKIVFKFDGYDGRFPAANIRITFDEKKGSYSYIGNDATHVRSSRETMNFGWINRTESEESIKQVVLHEFGHALGLIHEHQHPETPIPWDTAAVYAYYRNTQKPPWDEEKVDNEIFTRYAATSLNYTEYDSHSIMHYYIPDILTKGDFEIPWNTDLSPTDIDFIKKIYRP